MNNKYEVAFLILNYKTYKETIHLAKQLMAFKNFGSNYGLVIVDNASPNESWQELQKVFFKVSDVYLVKSEINGGYARGNNLGLRFMEDNPPKYVCIINNDVYFTEKIIQHLVDLFPSLPKAAIISPIQILPNGKPISDVNKINSFAKDLQLYFPSLLYRNKHYGYKQNMVIPNVEQTEIIQGAFCFADYKIIQSIGFFDERTFLYCEERIIARCLIDAGYHNYTILDETYLHNHSTTIRNEVHSRQQIKYLHEARKVYARYYRTHPKHRIAVMDFLYYVGMPYRWLREFAIKVVKVLIGKK